jgi:DNA modification methylase
MRECQPWPEVLYPAADEAGIPAPGVAPACTARALTQPIGQEEGTAQPARCSGGDGAAVQNHLYYGDNLQILREHIADESVDLIYLDPPFNSQATYNVLFRAPTGEQSAAQIEAFDDTWHWNQSAEQAFDEVMQSGNTDAAEMLRAMRAFLKENDVMAYLTMMAVRLLELHRVLKPAGSLYLHCDPTASHYLKILLDAVFGKTNYRNEIAWKRSSAHNDGKQGRRQYGRVQDIIFFYTKSHMWAWNQNFSDYSEDYLREFYKYTEEGTGRRYRLGDLTGPGGAAKGNPAYELMGVTRHWRYSREKMAKLAAEGRIVQTKPGAVPAYKRYLDEMPGVPLQDIWTDISPIGAQAQERLGYPTQKPVALLERIVAASSNPGDLVLDPFCGCGTTIHAAEKLGRRWIGIDITHLAISLIEKRLNDAFPAVAYHVHGTPKDLGGARALAAADKYQFQWWAVSLVHAVPYGGKRKGADRGIDGLIYFKPDGKTTEKAIVSVKGGEHVSVPMIRDLGHVVEREQARIGVFLCLAEPTQPMRTEAIKAGFYETPAHGKVPKIQILTIAELLEGAKPQIPMVDPAAFRQAPREDDAVRRQGKLL